ncbi:hypothetical protein AVEN_154851-1 [Araneus ventricosus]|uniref:Uncharacterized protein n=1 Tax=Araneus ventricosus TaxID=182803 RepID=A0A4Y2BV71_ARAVE|nr:hypothetical protein AVEN_154851-1 [Araneus ventricosus]
MQRQLRCTQDFIRITGNLKYGNEKPPYKYAGSCFPECTIMVVWLFGPISNDGPYPCDGYSSHELIAMGAIMSSAIMSVFLSRRPLFQFYPDAQAGYDFLYALYSRLQPAILG